MFLLFLSSLVECDRACKKSCTGAGPGNCKECAKGYRIKDDGKEDEDDEDEDNEDESEKGGHDDIVTCEGILFSVAVFGTSPIPCLQISMSVQRKKVFVRKELTV